MTISGPSYYQCNNNLPISAKCFSFRKIRALDETRVVIWSLNTATQFYQILQKRNNVNRQRNDRMKNEGDLSIVRSKSLPADRNKSLFKHSLSGTCDVCVVLFVEASK